MGSYVIAGSRSISDGYINGLFHSSIRDHNLQVLDDAVTASGFHTRVANLRTYNGPPGVRVCRGMPWGNPYTHLDGPTLADFKVSTRDEAIRRYTLWFDTQPDLRRRLPELKGQTLLCWCAPSACHGHYLAELAGRISLVVEGGARGVDRLARFWAIGNCVPHITINANWDQYGKSAGFRRNTLMAERDDVEGAIVLTTGSNGTAHTIREMERLHKQLFVQKVVVEDNLAYPV